MFLTDSEAQDEDSRFIFELDGDKWTVNKETP